MSSQPYMQFYVSDYLADTQHLTTEQHGAYLLLLFAMWRHGGKLQNDPSKLARISGVNLRRWHLICDDILAFFDVEDGAIFQKRLVEEYQKAVSKSEKRSVSGRAGGIAKSLKNKDVGLANASRLPRYTRAFPEPEPEPDISSLRSDISFAQNQDFERDFDLANADFKIEDLGNPAASPPQATASPPELARRANIEPPPPREPDRRQRQAASASPPDFELEPEATDCGAKAATRAASKASALKAQKLELEREFDAIFWPAVVRKVGRANARKAFPKARGKASLEAIMAGLERYQESLAAKGAEIQFWMHPTTFLNGERWADEPDPIITKQGKNNHEHRYQNAGFGGKPAKSNGTQIAELWIEFSGDRQSGDEVSERISDDFLSWERTDDAGAGLLEWGDFPSIEPAFITPEPSTYRPFAQNYG